MRIKPRKRPKITHGYSEKLPTGCGSLYIQVNHDDKGVCEIFPTLGHTGGCATAQLEAIGRLVSVCLRCDVDIEVLVTQLQNIRCPSPAMDGEVKVLSCADAIAKVLRKEIPSESIVDATKTP